MRDPRQDDPLRRDIRDDPSSQRVGRKSSHGFIDLLTHWKLALGILLLVLLVLFVTQNADVIHVKFLVWETDLSQALVIFSTLLAGVLIGVMVTGWHRWRLSHSSRDHQ